MEKKPNVKTFPPHSTHVLACKAKGTLAPIPIQIATTKIIPNILWRFIPFVRIDLEIWIGQIIKLNAAAP